MKRIVIFCIIVCCSLMACTKVPGGHCADGDFVILREDEGNRRLFVKGSDESVKDLDVLRAELRSVENYIEKCMPQWGETWSVSVFTEKKYASYKDDEAIRPYVMDGSWEKNYLVEYNNTKKSLTRYPLDPKRRLLDKIDVSD